MRKAILGLLDPPALPGLGAPLVPAALPGSLVNVAIPGPQGPQVRAVPTEWLARRALRDLKASQVRPAFKAPQALRV